MLLIIPKLLDDHALQQLYQVLPRGQWQAGRLSAGGQAAGVKNNLQLDDSDALTQQISRFVQQHLERHPQFVSAALPKQIYPPKFNCYRDGGHYGLHVDSAVLSPPDRPTMRSDVSATLFLSNPDSYDGGELEIETAFGAQQIKLNAGDLVLYPSSSLHQVQPVSRGERICAFLWVQSLVPDSGQREMLYELVGPNNQLDRRRLCALERRCSQGANACHQFPPGQELSREREQTVRDCALVSRTCPEFTLCVAPETRERYRTGDHRTLCRWEQKCVGTPLSECMQYLQDHPPRPSEEEVLARCFDGKVKTLCFTFLI